MKAPGLDGIPSELYHCTKNSMKDGSNPKNLPLIFALSSSMSPMTSKNMELHVAASLMVGSAPYTKRETPVSRKTIAQ